MIYTKEEFKRLWESDESGGGITNDDCADCAKAWGLYSNPRCAKLDEVVYRVCEAAGVSSEDMPYNPFKEEVEKSEAEKHIFLFGEKYVDYFSPQDLSDFKATFEVSKLVEQGKIVFKDFETQKEKEAYIQALDDLENALGYEIYTEIVDFEYEYLISK